MFAILIEDDTLEMITVMNGGITPDVETDEDGQPTTFFLWLGHDVEPVIISETNFDDMRDLDRDWEARSYGIWRK